MLSEAMHPEEDAGQEGFQPIKPRQVLAAPELDTLNRRSDLKGIAQLMGHLAILTVSGFLWATQRENAWVAGPALIVYGFGFAAMFAPLHECVHRTAFGTPRLNDAVAWVAGLLSFYNSTFYRRYHKWHHRYTQIPGKDPELNDPTPQSWSEYLWTLSGLPWWFGKIQGHWRLATGQVQGYPFLSDKAQTEAIRSIRWQGLVYGIAIALSIALGHPWAFLLYWVLPLAVGQPILRFILLAEHSHCAQDDNPFANTRTTLTLFPLRFMMWNMPFHAEHHLYPSIPFHSLAKAHLQLRKHFTQVEPGYIAVNRNIAATFGAVRP